MKLATEATGTEDIGTATGGPTLWASSRVDFSIPNRLVFNFFCSYQKSINKAPAAMRRIKPQNFNGTFKKAFLQTNSRANLSMRSYLCTNVCVSMRGGRK